METVLDAGRYYEGLAKNHPTPEWHTFEQRKALLRRSLDRYLAHETRRVVLDAGCGEGQFLEFFAGLGFGVHGLDIAPTAIERARARVPGAGFAVGSVEDRLPFPDGAFSAVWCTEVIEHLFDVGKTLREFHRVLQPGGLAILTTPFHGFWKLLAMFATGTFERHFYVSGPHIRFFTQRSLGQLLVQAGLTPVEWAGFGRAWPLYKSFYVVARKPAAAQAG